MDIKFFDKAAAYFPDMCFKTPPDLGILLGSGWGEALVMDEVIFRAKYSDIPGMGASTVKGHAGEFIYYRRKGKIIAAWCGRRHYYEGDGWESVVLPMEMMRRMGTQRVLLTNAAGGINANYKAGDLVILSDHINLVKANPLVGAHVAEWGERFPDMSEVYSRKLSQLLRECANHLGIKTESGVYAFNMGPVYETPAEVRAYKGQGADLVGMSTVPEAVFGKACGISIVGLSLVTNMAAGISPHPLSHAEVIEAGEAAKPKMRELIDEFIQRM